MCISSLTSQLAYLNQVEEIHTTIIKTESIVTAVSTFLLKDTQRSNIDAIDTVTNAIDHNMTSFIDTEKNMYAKTTANERERLKR